MPLDSESFTLPEAPTLPTTPKARVAYLRDFIAQLPDEKFDMGTFSEEQSCGTVCCIAGWADILFDFNCRPKPTCFFDEEKAAEELGLQDNTWRRLFFAGGIQIGYATRLRAVRVLDIMLETWDEPGGSRVDWESAIRDVPA